MNDILFLKKEKVLANRTIYIEIKGRILKSIDTLTKYFEGERLAETCKKGCPNYVPIHFMPSLKYQENCEDYYFQGLESQIIQRIQL